MILSLGYCKVSNPNIKINYNKYEKKQLCIPKKLGEMKLRLSMPATFSHSFIKSKMNGIFYFWKNTVTKFFLFIALIKMPCHCHFLTLFFQLAVFPNLKVSVTSVIFIQRLALPPLHGLLVRYFYMKNYLTS